MINNMKKTYRALAIGLLIANSFTYNAYAEPVRKIYSGGKTACEFLNDSIANLIGKSEKRYNDESECGTILKWGDISIVKMLNEQGNKIYASGYKEGQKNAKGKISEEIDVKTYVIPSENSSIKKATN